MHNPDTFGFLQFAQERGEALCGNVEWPARYVLAQIYQAEIAYVQTWGNYTENLWTLLRGYCTLDNGCSAQSLSKVGSIYSHIFNLKIQARSLETPNERCVHH